MFCGISGFKQLLFERDGYFFSDELVTLGPEMEFVLVKQLITRTFTRSTFQMFSAKKTLKHMSDLNWVPGERLRFRFTGASPFAQLLPSMGFVKFRATHLCHERAQFAFLMSCSFFPRDADSSKKLAGATSIVGAVITLTADYQKVSQSVSASQFYRLDYSLSLTSLYPSMSNYWGNDPWDYVMKKLVPFWQFPPKDTWLGGWYN